MIRPGVGFSSDSGVIGQLIYEQRNFDITDTPENLGRGSSSPGRPGAAAVSASPSGSNPARATAPIPSTSSIRTGTISRSRSTSWAEAGNGSAKATTRIGSRAPSNSSSAWRTTGGAASAFAPKTSGSATWTSMRRRRSATSRATANLFGVKFGVGKTAVDDLYDPTTGWIANASYEQVTGDFTFGLLEGSFVRYFTLHEDVLGRKTVLSGKVLAATTVGDAPPFEKYYAGGSGRYGIRGFEYRGVSPRGLQTNVANPKRKDPIGSDWIFLAGIGGRRPADRPELQRPVLPRQRHGRYGQLPPVDRRRHRDQGAADLREHADAVRAGLPAAQGRRGRDAGLQLLGRRYLLRAAGQHGVRLQQRRNTKERLLMNGKTVTASILVCVAALLAAMQYSHAASQPTAPAAKIGLVSIRDVFDGSKKHALYQAQTAKRVGPGPGPDRRSDQAVRDGGSRAQDAQAGDRRLRQAVPGRARDPLQAAEPAGAAQAATDGGRQEMVRGPLPGDPQGDRGRSRRRRGWTSCWRGPSRSSRLPARKCGRPSARTKCCTAADASI